MEILIKVMGDDKDYYLNLPPFIDINTFINEVNEITDCNFKEENITNENFDIDSLVMGDIVTFSITQKELDIRYLKSLGLYYKSCFIENEDIELVNVYLNVFDINCKCDDTENTPLIHACMKGFLNISNILIDMGANLEAKNEHELTALNGACLKGYYDIAHKLIEKGAKIETKDEEEMSPLNNASVYGYNSIIDLLLDNGADINTLDEYKLTPLLNAISNNNTLCALTLIRRGADLEMKDIVGINPLIASSMLGKYTVMELLLKRGVDMEEEDEEEHTALYKAIMCDSDKCVKLLLSNGAKENRYRYSDDYNYLTKLKKYISDQ